MVRHDSQPVLLEAGDSNVLLPEVVLVTSVLMLDALLGSAKQQYSGDALIKTTSEKESGSTSKGETVKKDACVQLDTKLKIIVIIKLIP